MMVFLWVVDYRKDEGYITPVEAAGEDKVLCKSYS